MLKIRRYRASDHNEVWNLHNLALDQVGANAGSGAQDNDLQWSPHPEMQERFDDLLAKLT